MPKISVIVPVYNVEKYLPRCLDSLVNQTERNIEIIIVNDGTKDNSQKIIDQYAQKYSGMIKSFIKANGGLSDARNFGLPYATGEYVAFLDSDDYVDLNMYEEMLKYSANGTKKIVTCGYSMEWNDHKKEKIDELPKSLEDYVASGLVVAWNKLYKRDWLINTGVLFPVGLLYEDTEFFCKLMTYITSVDEIAIVTKSYIHYIQRSDSISYSEASRIDDIHNICDNVISFYKEKQVSEVLCKAVEYKFTKALLGNFFRKYLSIPDRKIRMEQCLENWQYIHTRFPGWKRNPFVRMKNGLATKAYLVFINKTLYKLMVYAAEIIPKN